MEKKNIDFEGCFKELKKFKDLRKKINSKNTYKGIFGDKEINSCEEIIIRKYMLYELFDTNDYYVDLSAVISGIFNNMPDKACIKKERKNDTSFRYYEPKTKEFPDGIVGESFNYFGNGKDGEWAITTLEPKNCIHVFGYHDAYSRGKSFWIKFNQNKSLDAIEEIAHKRVVEIKKKSKEDYNKLSSFEKDIISIDRKRKQYYKSCKIQYTRSRIKEEVDKIKSSYNQEIAFSYFPELFELEIIKKISKKYNLDMKCSEYVYDIFRQRNFSNSQWNNAIKHYSLERQKDMESNEDFYFYYYDVRKNEFYN